MTRINCIPARLLLDKHLKAHLNEGLRPINNLRNGKYVNISKESFFKYRLNSGHELFCAQHSAWTLHMWMLAKQEYDRRGFKGYGYKPSLDGIRAKYRRGYTVTLKDCEINLERIKERFMARSKPYHYLGKVIDTDCEFEAYYDYVIEQLLIEFGG